MYNFFCIKNVKLFSPKIQSATIRNKGFHKAYSSDMCIFNTNICTHTLNTYIPIYKSMVLRTFS